MLSFPAEGSFQLTAARRRLGIVGVIVLDGDGVSTHSRPKAAGYVADFDTAADLFQLTAARRRLDAYRCGQTGALGVSTHSRPKAAGYRTGWRCRQNCRFQLTAARRRLGLSCLDWWLRNRFQLTAARRRLVTDEQITIIFSRFNSQPPEGGWVRPISPKGSGKSFNSQPPEGGWPKKQNALKRSKSFNSQPPEGGWELWPLGA